MTILNTIMLGVIGVVAFALSMFCLFLLTIGICRKIVETFWDKL